MKYICPLIAVSDLRKSRDFYVNLLNQRVKFDFGENITFHGDFAIHLDSHYNELIEKPVTYGGNNFELYFEEKNIEQFVDKLKENDVKFVHDIKEQPWRQKVVRFYDLDKNIIEVGEPLEFLTFRLHNEGLKIADIAATTNMPEGFVKMSIDNKGEAK